MAGALDQLIEMVKGLKETVKGQQKELDQLKLEGRALKAQVLFIQGRLSINPSRQPAPEHFVKDTPPAKEEKKDTPPAPASEPKSTEAPK